MAKIVIDVVLLPPKEVMDKAIEVNKELADDPIKLSQEDCIPHISLCMGVIEKENLPKINEIINKIGKDFSELPLTIIKIDGEGVCFEIKNTKSLQRLHEVIMEKLSPYLSYDATADMCFAPSSIVEKALSWINKYKDKSSSENFYPHITLGASKLKSEELNIKFTASRLALCHMGNYCTCRKVLHEVSLQK